jgi:hypothetical protein
MEMKDAFGRYTARLPVNKLITSTITATTSKEMDQTTAHVRQQTNQPKYKQDHQNCPKHRSIPSKRNVRFERRSTSVA